MTVSGSPFDFVLSYLGGAAVSFTPCIYPLIPITAGYIGATSSGSKIKGFLLSIVYVSGVAVTYSLLGVVAALTGGFFGRISALPVTNIIVGAVVLFFGLSMLEVFTITLPNIIRLPVLKKQNYFSTFLLGLSSGFLVSPCLISVLGPILAYIATKQNVVYGAILLFSFAYGMGLLLILIGTFSALLVNLPKSGKWLTLLKRFYALIIIGVGIYFIVLGLRRLNL
ncbi:MAG: cytochrome c biogenesis protein CcdA [Candidatus Omnitrophota bacterium]